MSIKKRVHDKIFPSATSLDKRWSVRANTRLFAVEKNKDASKASESLAAKSSSFFFGKGTDPDSGKRDDDGTNETMFFTSEAAADKLLRRYPEGEMFVRAYDIFCPDALVRRVSGKLERPKENKHLIAYTDGSFVDYDGMHVIAYGVFAVCGDMSVEYSNTIVDNAFKMGSMGGEFAAAVVAIKAAIAKGFESIEIIYDFDGVSIFDDPGARSPNSQSKMFWLYEQYQSFLECVKDKIDVSFTKVKAHTYNLGNEHANFLAYTHAKIAAKSLLEKDESSYLPYWVPKTDKDYEVFEESSKILANTIAKSGKESVSFQELDYAISADKCSRMPFFGKTEKKYVRLIACGARGKEIIKEEFPQMTRAQRATMRQEIAVKLGLDKQGTDEKILQRIIEIIVCGRYASQAESGDATEDNKESKERSDSTSNKGKGNAGKNRRDTRKASKKRDGGTISGSSNKGAKNENARKNKSERDNADKMRNKNYKNSNHKGADNKKRSDKTGKIRIDTGVKLEL